MTTSCMTAAGSVRQLQPCGDGEVRANMLLFCARAYTCEDKHAAPLVPLVRALITGDGQLVSPLFASSQKAMRRSHSRPCCVKQVFHRVKTGLRDNRVCHQCSAIMRELRLLFFL